MPAQTDHGIEMETCGCRLIHHDRVNKARQKDIPPKPLTAMSNIFKAMGDPTRLRILHALQDGEMCVCDIAAFIGLSESAVSHQLRHLRELAIVKNRRGEKPKGVEGEFRPGRAWFLGLVGTVLAVWGAASVFS